MNPIYAGDDPVNRNDPTGKSSGGASSPTGVNAEGQIWAIENIPQAWADAFLQQAGVLDNQYNDLVALAWVVIENGWSNGSNNPLGSTLQYNSDPGEPDNSASGTCNGLIVQCYPNKYIGMIQDASNLDESPYAAVRSAFDADTSASTPGPVSVVSTSGGSYYTGTPGSGPGWAVVHQIAISPWGTSGEGSFDATYSAVLKGNQTIPGSATTAAASSCAAPPVVLV